MSGNIGVSIAATVRFFLLTGIEYHDHVTEWGVHWNFFLTVGLLGVFSVFLRSSKNAMLYGLILLLAFEFASLQWDLRTYIFYAPRTNMISANKEGILSLPGYLAIQLIGIGIGSDIYQTLVYINPRNLMAYNKTKDGIAQNHAQEKLIFYKLVVYCVLLLVASELCLHVFD